MKVVKHLDRLGTRGFKVFIITGESSETFRQTWDRNRDLGQEYKVGTGGYKI